MLLSRKNLLFGAAGFTFLTGLLCATLSPMAQNTDRHSVRLKLDKHREIGQPSAFRNLTLIPIYDDTARPADTYMTLDEGMKSKQVSVKESKEGGDVNTLYVTNDGAKPLYLMGGEVVLGGQQDRCLARDTIILPGKHDVPVTVFCVEHGRWSGHREFDNSAPTVASIDIRSKAQNGEFYAARESSNQIHAMTSRPVAGISGREVNRIAAVDANTPTRASSSGKVSSAQQQVWDKVAQKNMKLKTGSSTGTYRTALTLAGGDAQKSVPAYLKSLSDSLGKDSHLVGVAAAINGKVVAADIFDNPILFQKLWPKLLRSFAADAVENASSNGKSAQKVSSNQVKDFLIGATDAKSRIENKSDVSSTVRYESSQAVTFSLVPTGKNGKVMGGFGGGAVHTGVIGK